MSLHLDWCSYGAAKYAVEHWHYSETLPRCPMAKIGVWEDGLFVGAVLFGMGSGGATDGRRYDGLAQRFAVGELVRVALRAHQAPVSQIVAVAVRKLRQQSPGLRLLLSYADPAHNHHGGIYQAMGWYYVGLSAKDYMIVDQSGHRWHSRVVSSKGWKNHFGSASRAIRPSEGTRIDIPGKYTYLLPLDAETRARIEPLARQYPKRAGSIAADAPADQVGEGGSSPTSALQTTAVRA